MNRFRLSSGVLSPIHSDISLNDSTALSFGSISGIPDVGKEIESPKCESIGKDSNVDSFCKRTMKESAAAFDVIVNDIKKQSNINAEREERFKESYEMLQNSMDELFYKVSRSSVLSPISNDRDLENVNRAEKVPSEKTNVITEIPENPTKDWEKKGSTNSKTLSEISSRKSRKRGESKVINRRKESNQQSENVFLERTEDSKHCKVKTHLENEIDAKGGDSACELQKPKTSKMISSSTQTCERFEAVEAKEKENLKNFYSQKQRQREAAVSNSTPAIENKNLSIEKSIQIAGGMEMDNLRRFILDQNLRLHKELQKLKETAKQQGDVTRYLFSVIHELEDENKKLMSKF